MNDDRHAPDPRFEPRPAGRPQAPRAIFPIPEGHGLRVVECVHCGGHLGVTRWEYLNGFLVQCPHCRGYHGGRWSLQKPILSGLLLNALSFFFVLRPRNALIALTLFVAVAAVLVAYSAQDDMNAARLITAISFIVFGPILLNAALLVRHQWILDAAPPRDDGSRTIG